MVGDPQQRELGIMPEASLWANVVHPDDVHIVSAAWVTVKDEKQPMTAEYRLKRPWRSVDKATGHEVTGETWLLASAAPDLDSDGNVLAVQGWLTDISHRKFSENLLAQRLADALETKRQSENFIDMTSHEVRDVSIAVETYM